MNYQLKEIITKLNEAGIRCTRPTIEYWQKVGKLKLRKLPYNNFRVATEQDLEDIIKSFSFGGKGYWHAG
jgi:hypothetical protein